MGLLGRLYIVFLGFGCLYGVFLLSLTVPYVQRGAIYLHWIRYPINANFNRPEKYGIAPGKVRNFNLTTPDGARIGVWHALPESVYAKQLEQSRADKILGLAATDFADSVFDDALRSHKTVLYAHGNAASRAQSFRTHMLRGMTRPIPGACDSGLNFVIFDYRGFADSSPASQFPPSEAGLILDARTVFDFLVKTKGVRPEQIGLVGQSLGTGVTVGLAAELEREGITTKGVGLVAPFSSVGELLRTYKLGKTLPVLSPLNGFPQIQKLFLKSLRTKFDSGAVIETIRSPILLIHAEDDLDIHPSHSNSLFDILLSPTVPLPPKYSLSDFQRLNQSTLIAEIQEREALVAQHVKIVELGAYGRARTFERGEGKGRVVHLEANSGAHNQVGYSEVALRAIAELVCR